MVGCDDVYLLLSSDVRKFNSNQGGFLAAEYLKHDGELTSIVKQYIEELKFGTPKYGVIVMVIK